MRRDRQSALDRRRLLQLARRYRSNGYRVVIPDGSASTPEFLRGYSPDLIAESTDDKVVVVIKNAATIPGSNDIVDLANSIEGQAGWRFELIALKAPAALLSLDEPTFDDMIEETQSLLASGFIKAAYVVAWSRIEAMAMSLAARYRIDPLTRTHARLIHDMTALGLITGEMRERLIRALRTRNEIAHAAAADLVKTTDVEALLALGHDLIAEADVQKVA